MIDITYLHKRYDIDNLSKKERNELLDKMIDNQIDLLPNEEKMLNKKQLEKYTNFRFRRRRWMTPDEWKTSDETQKELYMYNGNRTAVSPELFASMDKTWRKNYIMAVGVLSGFSFNKNWFDTFSESERKYYVNKKLIKTSSFYPYEIQYLKTDKQKSLIDHLLHIGLALEPEEIEGLASSNKKYYMEKSSKFVNEQKIRKFVRNLLYSNI